MDASIHSPSQGLVQTLLVMSERPVVRQHLFKDLRRTGLFPVLATSPDHGRRLLGEVVLDAVLIDLDDAPCCNEPSSQSLISETACAFAATLMLTSDINRRCGAHNQACQASLCLDARAPLREIAGLVASHLRGGLEGPVAGTGDPQALQVGLLQLDTTHGLNRVRHAGSGATARLSDAEMDLLRSLMLHAGQLLSRAQLMQLTREGSIGERTIDQNIKRLRSALAPLGLNELIATVRGAGYRLETERPSLPTTAKAATKPELAASGTGPWPAC